MKTETLHVTETEERILNAALKVVNDVTISGTRMHLIAEKADMVQSNVHYYYKTKQELLKGLQEWILEECYDMQQVSKKIKQRYTGRSVTYFLSAEKNTADKEERI